MTVESLLADAVVAAEARRREGDDHGSVRSLIEALRRSLAENDGDLLGAELAALELVGGLAVVAGHADAATEILELAAAGQRARERTEIADYLDLQRVHIALTAGDTGIARAILRDMPSIGPVEELPDSEAALLAWERASRWKGQRASLLRVYAYGELARLFLALGFYEVADVYAQRGIALAVATGEPAHVRERAAALRLIRAEAALIIGDLPRAGALLATSADLDARRHPAWWAEMLALRMRTAMLAGDLGSALRDGEALLAWNRELRSPDGIAAGALNLAELRYVLNQTTAARELVRAALDSGTRRIDILSRAVTIGEMIRLQRPLWFNAPAPLYVTRTSEVVADVPEWQESEPALPFRLPDSEAEAFEICARELRSVLDDAGRAADVLIVLRRRFTNTESPLIRARMLLLEGLSEYAAAMRAASCESFENAKCFLAAAASGFAAMGMLPDLYEAQRWLAWSMRLLSEDDHGELRRANGELLQRISTTLQVEDRAAFLLNKWSDEEEDLADELDRMTKARTLEGNGLRARWRQAARLSAFLDRLYGLKESLARKWIGGIPEEAVDGLATPLRKRLLMSPRRATMAILVLPTKTVTIVMSLGRIQYFVEDLDRERVRELVREWHTAPGHERRAKATELARLFEKPLAVLPRLVRHLTIIPDDALHGFPFAILPLPDGGLLVDRYSFAIASYSATIARPAVRPAEHVAALVGMTRGHPEQPILRRAGEALELVRKHLDAKRLKVPSPLIDDEATTDAVLRALSMSSFFHVTCHGEFAPDDAAKTGILLADGSGGVATLSLRELYGIDLRHLRQAALVSCWSADSFIRSGRFIVSLAEVLCRGGAESVIASLWDVDERHSPEFMELFYRNLARYPRARALQRTQLEAQSFCDQQVWAAFQIYGDAGRLRLKGFS